MHKLDDMYEYDAVYVYDLERAMKNPKEFADISEKKHKCKTKGTGPLSFDLGLDYSLNEDNTLCLSSTKYVEKLIKSYQRIFGEPPKQNVSSPLEKGDHPELDTSEFFDEKVSKHTNQ
jgi:hypothetical protein